MSVFNIFGKKDKNPKRLSGVERFETKVSRPIKYMTEHGGSCPLDYDLELVSLDMMRTEPEAFLNKLIEEGSLDEFSDLSVIYDIIRQRSLQAQLDLKNQNIIRHEVAGNIRIVAREAIHLLDGQEKLNKREMKELDGGRFYEECNSEEKGLGDDYE